LETKWTAAEHRSSSRLGLGLGSSSLGLSVTAGANAGSDSVSHGNASPDDYLLLDAGSSYRVPHPPFSPMHSKLARHGAGGLANLGGLPPPLVSSSLGHGNGGIAGQGGLDLGGSPGVLLFCGDNNE
jgi:hypothetical protein